MYALRHKKEEMQFRLEMAWIEVEHKISIAWIETKYFIETELTGLAFITGIAICVLFVGIGQ
jgi:hypothetical protein